MVRLTAASRPHDRPDQAEGRWQVIRDSVIAHLIDPPDRNMRVQLIIFIEEDRLSTQDTDNLALELLRSLNPGAINVTAAIVRSDGIEYRVWNGLEDGRRGNSFYWPAQ